MARNVKTIPEKKIDVEKTVGKLLETSGLKIDEFLFKTSISMDAYRKMVDRGNLSKGAVENILDNFDVNEGFLKGEEDLTSSGKLTGVQDEPAIPQKNGSWEGQTFRKIIEGGTEYMLVPRAAFEGNHRFTSIEQIEMQAKELEMKSKELKDRNDQIQNLTNLLISAYKDIASGRLPQLSKIEEAQKNTPV